MDPDCGTLAACVALSKPPLATPDLPLELGVLGGTGTWPPKLPCSIVPGDAGLPCINPYEASRPTLLTALAEPRSTL